MRKLTIATRGSPLALWQANHVAQLLQAQAPDTEIQCLPLVTAGDVASAENRPAPTHKGLFVKELEAALLDKRADLAVHSLKDMSVVLPDDLCLAAICERANPFDAFVSPLYASIDALPLHATVGTASLRRQSQLLAYRPDLQVKTIRGNIQTRLDKLKSESLDALILAAAGLARLNLSHLIRTTVCPPLMIPSCGQGALGIECRADDHPLQALLQTLHCKTSALCVQTERHANALLGGHCQVPLGIFCRHVTPEQLQLTIRILHPQGHTQIETTQIAPVQQASALAEACVQAVQAQGADALLNLRAPDAEEG